MVTELDVYIYLIRNETGESVSSNNITVDSAVAILTELGYTIKMLKGIYKKQLLTGNVI